MNISRRAAWCLLAAVSFWAVSCKTDPDSILGNGMHSDSDLVAKYDTAFSIEAFSVADDSLIMQNASTVLLGTSFSPVWGSEAYNLIVQLLTLRTENADYHSGNLDDDFRVDSVVMYLPYSGLFPTHDRMDGRAWTFSVYEVTEKLVDGVGYDSAYSSNYQVQYNPVPLSGPITVNPKPFDTVYDTVAYATLVTPLKVYLSKGLGERLLSTVCSMSETEQADLSAFPKYFGGIYLKTEPCLAEDGTIVFSVSNLYAEGAKITVYFDGNETGTSFQDFILGPLRYTQVERDRSLSSDPLYKAQMATAGDTVSGGQKLYIESSGGSRVRFRIPNFPSEIDGDKIVINQAVIVLPEVEGDDLSIGRPGQLSCFRYFNRGTEAELPDASDPGGYYDEDAGEYRLNVTRYFQQLAYLCTVDSSNRKNYANYLDVTAISDNRYETPLRVVLRGPKAEGSYMRMEVIYTVVNDSVNR